eukprot:2137256-Amphidinium_carterae.1
MKHPPVHHRSSWAHSSRVCENVFREKLVRLLCDPTLSQVTASARSSSDRPRTVASCKAFSSAAASSSATKSGGFCTMFSTKSDADCDVASLSNTTVWRLA